MEAGVRKLGEVLVRVVRKEQMSKKRSSSFLRVNSADSQGKIPHRSMGRGRVMGKGRGPNLIDKNCSPWMGLSGECICGFLYFIFNVVAEETCSSLNN